MNANPAGEIESDNECKYRNGCGYKTFMASPLRDFATSLIERDQQNGY